MASSQEHRDYPADPVAAQQPGERGIGGHFAFFAGGHSAARRQRFACGRFPNGVRHRRFARVALPRPMIAEVEGGISDVRLAVWEDDLDYYVRAEMAQVPADCFQVESQGKRLTIRVSGVGPQTRDSGRACLDFSRPFDAESSTGECADGVLWLRLSKCKA